MHVALQCPRSATSIVYTPDPDHHGQDSFSYVTVRQWPPTGDLFPFSFPAEVALEVLPVEDAPRPVADFATIDENTSVTIDLADNDVDPDGNLDPTTVAADPCVEEPVCLFKSLANGSWVLHGDGTVTYTPTPNFTGTAGFHYQISDTAGNTSRSWALVIVRPDPAVDDDYTTDEDTTLVVAAPGVLTNDAAGSTTATLASPPSHGTLTLASDGSFTYVPQADFNGEDTFTYTGLNGDLATVTVDVVTGQRRPHPGSQRHLRPDVAAGRSAVSRRHRPAYDRRGGHGPAPGLGQRRRHRGRHPRGRLGRRQPDLARVPLPR